MVAALLCGVLITQSSVEGRLKGALAGIDGVRYNHEDGTMIVRYRTEVVKVLRRTNGVRVLSETVPEERPTLTGFKLETYDFDHGRNEPARSFQAVRMNAHWIRDYGTFKMDAVDRQVDGAEKGRYYYLLWGNKVDPKLIARIRSAVETGTRAMPGG